jgi:hypothetical protein
MSEQPPAQPPLVAFRIVRRAQRHGERNPLRHAELTGRGPAHRDHQEPAQKNPVPACPIDGFLAQTGLTLEPEPP